jgi:hypothetical protein
MADIIQSFNWFMYAESLHGPEHIPLVVLVEETGVPEENHRSVSRPTLSHVISSTPIMIRTHNFSGDRH